jgi:very-short-patch-repair endonuclease
VLTIHFNKFEERDKRRKLRNNPTPAEKKIWQFLRKKLMLGYKFRRQYGIDGFVIDFYCPRVKLGVEIDGDVHESDDVKIYDLERQKYLEQFGVSFLRFSNEEVLASLETVLGKIELKLRELDECKK